MGGGDRERGETRRDAEVQRTVFQVHISLDAVSFPSHSLVPSSFPTHPLPLSRACVPSPSPSSRIFPSAFSYTHIRPPVSLLSFPAPPPSCRHPREPSELSEPLWISPYATYWAQDVLRVVRERNLRAREMNPVKRPVAFINIAAGAFIRRASIYRVLDARPALPVSRE